LHVVHPPLRRPQRDPGRAAPRGPTWRHARDRRARPRRQPDPRPQPCPRARRDLPPRDVHAAGAAYRAAARGDRGARCRRGVAHDRVAARSHPAGLHALLRVIVRATASPPPPTWLGRFAELRALVDEVAPAAWSDPRWWALVATIATAETRRAAA